MPKRQIAALAEQIYRAEKSRTAIAPLTEAHPDLTVPEAYQIQLAYVGRRLADGAKVVGKKIGLTSQAIQQQLGVDQPDYGHLFDTMLVPEGEPVRASELIQARIEVEVAFVLGKDLRGPGVDFAQALAATRFVIPAFEIIDSRIENWRIKLQDTVADNGSSARYVLGGRPTPVENVDLRLVGMILEKNGTVVASGLGAASLGHPARAVAWLANALAAADVPLLADEVILSGSLGAAISIEPGDVFHATIGELGCVSARIV
jgi:2-keto-4-pentenoate hydratase